ncbi:MAG: DUF262 domain-containing protein [Tepidisphaeraceae bacterium]
MDKIPTNMTVADYCTAMDRSEIRVNRTYQRSDKVWPTVAQSFLIETVILSYPLPKLYLYSHTDLKTRITIKEIVDGQQRSKAIHDFFNDKLILSPKLETERLAGRTYSQLDEEDQQSFANYALPIDLFLSATSEEIREVFRRMNSYTVPLNPEEQRHASYQGEFKWFAYKLGKAYSQPFVDIGLFKDKQLVRMSDAKLITEICHSLIHGIATTKRKELDELYDTRDKRFPEQKWISNRLHEAFDYVLGLKQLHGTALMKPFIVYSLVLAVSHCKKPVKQLQPDFKLKGPRLADDENVQRNLLKLAAAIEDGDGAPFDEFVRACSSKTNVREQRVIRFKALVRAIRRSEI